jgi:hypothetical protein
MITPFWGSDFEEVISRQASFLHHPERVLHMLQPVGAGGQRAA